MEKTTDVIIPTYRPGKEFGRLIERLQKQSCPIHRIIIMNTEEKFWNKEWDEKYPCKDMGNGKVRSVGVSMAMQGSGISGVDVGSATIKLNDDGLYTLSIAAADMGTGCDTILAQMAAECLECSIDDIMVSGADTDTSPYDSGSYASSSTYVTGKAVERACEKLKGRILNKAAQMMEIDSADNLEFDGKKVSDPESGKEISLVDISTASMVNNNET